MGGAEKVPRPERLQIFKIGGSTHKTNNQVESRPLEFIHELVGIKNSSIGAATSRLRPLVVAGFSFTGLEVSPLDFIFKNMQPCVSYRQARFP